MTASKRDLPSDFIELSSISNEAIELSKKLSQIVATHSEVNKYYLKQRPTIEAELTEIRKPWTNQILADKFQAIQDNIDNLDDKKVELDQLVTTTNQISLQLKKLNEKAATVKVLQTKSTQVDAKSSSTQDELVAYLTNAIKASIACVRDLDMQKVKSSNISLISKLMEHATKVAKYVTDAATQIDSFLETCDEQLNLVRDAMQAVSAKSANAIESKAQNPITTPLSSSATLLNKSKQDIQAPASAQPKAPSIPASPAQSNSSAHNPRTPSVRS